MGTLCLQFFSPKSVLEKVACREGCEWLPELLEVDSDSFPALDQCHASRWISVTLRGFRKKCKKNRRWTQPASRHALVLIMCCGGAFSAAPAAAPDHEIDDETRRRGRRPKIGVPPYLTPGPQCPGDWARRVEFVSVRDGSLLPHHGGQTATPWMNASRMRSSRALGLSRLW